jgi:hypothetical protein
MRERLRIISPGRKEMLEDKEMGEKVKTIIAVACLGNAENAKRILNGH